MPGDVENTAPHSPNTLAKDLLDLIQDLEQYLDYQKSLGISHVGTDEKTTHIMATWGTPEWKQHRFLSQGPTDARIMLVDSKGSFFRGKSGRLLVKILKAMHLTQDHVFICNTADPKEIRSRVEASCPMVIITLGSKAAALLLKTDSPMEKIQGKVHTYCGVKVMPTRHPDELIADQALKRGVWENMQQVMALAGLGHGG